MKKIINAKLYNTETATRILRAGSFSRIQLRETAETLYRKAGGEFFLECTGGPLSPYAEYREDGSLGCGTDLIPLTEDEAREWCESHADLDTYEQLFGFVSE